MVTRVSNNVNIDTNTLADNFGIEPDFIFVQNSNGNEYSTWAGNDVIDASRATFGSFVTNIYSGLGDDQIAGTGGRDAIYDGAGNDVVLAGAGDDRVYADIGNDIYYGGQGSDTVDFSYLNVLGPSITPDPMTEGVTFDLAVTGIQDLGLRGRDQFFGFESVVGSSMADKLSGDAGANTIDGAGGNDYLVGRAGNDTIVGGSGADFTIGGAGADTLDMSETAFARDLLVYTAISESGVSAGTFDTITSFAKGAAATADRIDLSRIDADVTLAGNQQFSYRGTLGFTTSAAGEVRVAVSGADTIVYVDLDADVSSEMTIKVSGVTGLSKIDFIL